jgi:hypothetical protein
MTDDPAKAVAELVRNFRRNEADYLRAEYNETQTRTEFITPLLEAFGWDVHKRTFPAASLSHGDKPTSGIDGICEVFRVPPSFQGRRAGS